ncbi:MAG: DUF1015 domain-containing protein [Patescibacteria group bacterium]|nr:DUF1015 domain-containing protein [Patescibacteria group bacterium]MDD5121486.1 DUF1015 domain-containing protein [Patescibacteria group bacterium]MDD5221958.1 DUF1015 domain-containing protein [Patescibacteria group bacterium]MDD5396352.1 DUF1015 domain-containing protein [Patescibacteria group bacterium]
MKNKIGVLVPEILLPKNVDLRKWSVVACDQYTSEPEYWQKVKKIVGSNPSTLNIIFPEVYLEAPGKQERIKRIKAQMKKYLQTVLTPEKCFVLVDRKTNEVKSRKGLIMALDLENYNYHKGAKSLIRCTEGTVLNRLPPRIAIRKEALIELPHILILIDDPKKTVVEPLFKNLKHRNKIYDFNLMFSGGHLRGYKINDEKIIEKTIKNLEKLADKRSFSRKYGVKNEPIVLFAAGDGNHSLATAKATWELFKKRLPKSKLVNHPARYALVEVLNIHDTGLIFEPIHRVLFNVNLERLLKEMDYYYKKQKSTLDYKLFKTDKAAEQATRKAKKGSEHLIKFVSGKKFGVLQIKNPKLNLEVGTLQSFLDEYLVKHKETKIDYVHGDKAVAKLGRKSGNLGFYLPVMDKHDLFKTVILDGALPRKTFSLGEADEKRYYLECRKIRP